MSCCAGSVQHRSNPGNVSYTMQTLYGPHPATCHELGPTDHEYICPERSVIDHEVGIDDGLSEVCVYLSHEFIYSVRPHTLAGQNNIQMGAIFRVRNTCCYYCSVSYYSRVCPSQYSSIYCCTRYCCTNELIRNSSIYCCTLLYE